MTPLPVETEGDSGAGPSGATAAPEPREPPWGRTRWGRPRWGPVSRQRRWRQSQATRVVAVLLLAVATWLTVSALLPTPPDPGPATVVMARDRPLGWTLTSDDLRLERRPADQRPVGAFGEVAAALGRVVSAPVLAGEIVTPARFRGAPQLAGMTAGSVAVSLPVDDPVLLTSLRPADTVAVLAAGSGAPLASAAQVLATDLPGSGGLTSAAGPRGHLVLAVTAEESRALAVAMGPSGSPGGFLVAVRSTSG
jgi:Flp pilus assembly protein CpaB